MLPEAPKDQASLCTTLENTVPSVFVAICHRRAGKKNGSAMEIESTGSWRLEPCKDVPPKDQGLDPRKVGQWIESLPLADTERLANTLIEAFRAWNAMCITPARRFQLLEDLRKQVGLAVEQLEGRFLRDDFPLPAREQGLARLARTLLDVFGQGYERVHLDLVGQGGIGGWWKRRYQRVAIHRAMSYLNRVLLACYQTYSPFPRNIWWEVHRLYTDALSANCADTVVEDDYHQFVWRTSVSDRYKQILLLALSNPDQMRPKVVRDLYGVLESLAALAKLGVPVNGKVGGAFLVLSPVDKGPQCACDSHTPVDREAFLLDTVDLEEELARWRRKASGRRVATEQNRVPLDSLSVEVVDRMIHAWGLRARRSMNRIHRHSEVWVLPGFHRIYAMLQSRLKQESGGSSDTEENLVTEVGSAWRGKSTSAINEVHPILCKVIDQSACGYRLMWPADAGVGVSMGGVDRTALAGRRQR